MTTTDQLEQAHHQAMQARKELWVPIRKEWRDDLTEMPDPFWDNGGACLACSAPSDAGSLCTACLWEVRLIDRAKGRGTSWADPPRTPEITEELAEHWATHGEPGAAPVGAVEIAERLKVNRSTVDQWRQRDLLPQPDFIVGGRPAWKWRTVAAWAADTGRL